MYSYIWNSFLEFSFRHFENMETDSTYETDDNIKKEPGRLYHQATGCEWSENVHISTYSLLKSVST
jgi:hypothetical protein